MTHGVNNPQTALWTDHCKWAGAVLAASAAGQLISLWLWMPEPQTHMVWLPGSVLLCALLVAPSRLWPACLVGGTLGVVLVLSLFGLPAAALATIAIGDLLMVVGAAAWLRRLRSARPPLEDMALLWQFVGICGLLLPALGAGWVIAVATYTGLDFYLGNWANVALAHSLAYLLIVPTWISHVIARERGPSDGLAQKSSWLIAPGMLVALWWVWTHLTPVPALWPLLVIAPVPILAWALIVFRTAGACYAMLAVGLLCMWVSRSGAGPFVQDTLPLTALSVQLWVVWASIALLFLSAISEQKTSARRALQATHAQLSQMTGRLILTQETERSHIARDLHDDINQSIASITLQLGQARQRAVAPLDGELAQLQSQLVGVSNDIRRVSQRLHPSVLRYTGLVPALKALCETGRARYRTSVSCDLPERLDLPEEHALCLYRVAQEALGNVERHAHARHATISVEVSPDRVVLCIADDGSGWDQDLVAARARGGLGVVSMEERTRLLGGTLQVRPRTHGGSMVIASLPLPSSQATGADDGLPGGSRGTEPTIDWR
ncbi:MAG: hypothetical protein EOP92_00890 [Lysobacteraceae bacterium]|nr:MAG: hypothetical protein EOP92_00890 [Xanthomonadaceae bacterium]